MTATEWDTSDDPERMRRIVFDSAYRADWPDTEQKERKRLLFGAACCRLVWPLITDERCRRLVEYLEQQFDRPVADDIEEEAGLVSAATAAARHPDPGTPHQQVIAANLVLDINNPALVIGYLLRSLGGWCDPAERAGRVAAILRDVVGNPFRPAGCDDAWRTDTVLAVARRADEARDYAVLPVLADALEDAGCDSADLLAHCRGGGRHVRGCWAVDAVLGRS